MMMMMMLCANFSTLFTARPRKTSAIGIFSSFLSAAAREEVNLIYKMRTRIPHRRVNTPGRKCVFNLLFCVINFMSAR